MDKIILREAIGLAKRVTSRLKQEISLGSAAEVAYWYLLYEKESKPPAPIERDWDTPEEDEAWKDL